MSEIIPLPEIVSNSTKDPIAEARAAIEAEKRGRAIAFQEELNTLIEKYKIDIIPWVTFEGKNSSAGIKIVPQDL